MLQSCCLLFGAPMQQVAVELESIERLLNSKQLSLAQRTNVRGLYDVICHRMARESMGREFIGKLLD